LLQGIKKTNHLGFGQIEIRHGGGEKENGIGSHWAQRTCGLLEQEEVLGDGDKGHGQESLVVHDGDVLFQHVRDLLFVLLQNYTSSVRLTGGGITKKGICVVPETTFVFGSRVRWSNSPRSAWLKWRWYGCRLYRRWRKMTAYPCLIKFLVCK